MPINPFAFVANPNPFPILAEARRTEPVSVLPGFNLWSVTRYEDCVSILRNSEAFSSNPLEHGPELLFSLAGDKSNIPPPSMLTLDPPDHTRLRSLVSRAFTARMVANLEPRIRQLTDELLDAALDGSGQIDLIDALAYPLPVIVIAEILGVPADHRDDFKRWSDALAASLGSGGLDQRIMQEAMQAREEFVAYFSGVFEQRRAEPREDLVSNLLRLEAEGDKLTPDELMSMCILLMAAGNETTTNLIGNAMLALAERPEVRDQVAANPALVPGLVEEALRFYPPVLATMRFTTRQVELGGQTIGQRQPVITWLASANRDESLFPDPDRFDVTREGNNRHLSFGLGIHFCLGAPLARLEAKVALEALLRRLLNFRRVDSAPLERINSFIFYGVKHLPLAYDAAVAVGD